MILCLAVVFYAGEVQRGTRRLDGVSFANGGDSVPERYFLVKNNEHMRVKYLLLFADGPPPLSLYVTKLLLCYDRFIVYCVAPSIIIVCHQSALIVDYRRLLSGVGVRPFKNFI